MAIYLLTFVHTAIIFLFCQNKSLHHVKNRWLQESTNVDDACC